MEITGETNHQSVKIYVTAYKLNGIIKVITKTLWDNLSVEDAIKLYEKRFKIDSGYKEKHTFQAITSSQNGIYGSYYFLYQFYYGMYGDWR